MNGKNAAPIYKFLKSQKGGIFGDAIKWNFTKFLLNKEGKVVERYAPTTSPLKVEVRTMYSFLRFLFLPKTVIAADCCFKFFLQKDIQKLLESS